MDEISIETEKNLTPREQEIMNLLLEGMALKEISGVLKISLKTVDFHRDKLYRKLGIQSNKELFKLFIKRSNLPPFFGYNTFSIPAQGNMGNYRYGYTEKGEALRYNQVVWKLRGDTLLSAKRPGAHLVIEFDKDISRVTEQLHLAIQLHLALIWQDMPTERFWSDKGFNDLFVYQYDENKQAYICKKGVTYDSKKKILNIDLETALETYSEFLKGLDVNFVLVCWNPEELDMKELGIVSANIVP